MRFLPGNSISEVIFNFIEIYLILTFIYTVVSIARMYYIEHKTNNVKSGKERIAQLAAKGHFIQMPVYSMEEMERNKDKADVRLFFFPNEKEEPSKFVLILPGGGYAHCCTKQEGYPVAAKLNKLGYSVFILEYRTRFKCSPFAPMEDVGNALQLIMKEQDRFNVTIEDYALMGFSAGGNLAGIFSSHKYGYMDFGVPKPKAVILGYPWTCVNDWLNHPYWNIWIGIMGIWLSNRGSLYMFGLHHMRKGRKELDMQKYIEADFPKTYLFTGSLDVLVPASRHADVLEAAFKANNIEYKYQKYFGLPHGIGLGENTKASGWLEEAVEFWEE